MLWKWSQNVPKQRAIFWQMVSLAYKLKGGTTGPGVKVRRAGFRAEEVVDSRGNIKLLNDEDKLELIQQEQVQNSTVELSQQEAQSSTVE